MAGKPGGQDQTGDSVKERTSEQSREPALFSVVLLNDDYTPMQFVVDVLEGLFQKTPSEAHRVMMQVHINGRGIAGVYTFDVAETKVASLVSLAREAGHPLQATIEDL
jgi:ATP-dependent Clp protease adaptor protein ClpS